MKGVSLQVCTFKSLRALKVHDMDEEQANEGLLVHLTELQYLEAIFRLKANYKWERVPPSERLQGIDK